MVTDIKQDIWQRLKECRRPIVLYGTGNGADKLLDEAHRVGIKISGIMASDGFVRNRSFRGFPVRSLLQIEEEFAEPMIVLAFGSQRPEVISSVLRLGERHTVLCADVPVYGENVFNMDFFNDHRKELEAAYKLMADEASRKTFRNIIRFRLSGKLQYLTSCFSEKEDVFSELLRLGEEESFLDLGAYRGDTISEFLHYTGGKYRHITALEPDIRNYRKLREYAKDMQDIQLFRMGIWSKDGELFFKSRLGRGSGINENGGETLAVTTIDTLYKRRPLSYLKLDVEGAEEQALIGGRDTIRRDQPKLNLALYHRSEDIFKLPLLLNEIQPLYKLFLRQHPHLPDWDLNLYAI